MTPERAMSPQPWQVVGVQRETPDVRTLELRPVGGDDYSFRPGQFNMLYVFGIGEVPISISGNPAESHRVLHTICAVGSVTRALCALRKGDVVGVRGPFGRGWPMEDAEGLDIVIVAGGIGLAPLRPALYHVLANRGKYGRVVLLYGSRTPRDLLYLRELERWRSRFDLQVEVTVDSAGEGWYGHVGVVTTLIPRAEFDPDEAVALICGPEIMMRFTVKALLGRGVSVNRIYISMERNMRCAIGFCGHCQFGPRFVCKDGPVFRFDQIAPFFNVREL